MGMPKDYYDDSIWRTPSRSADGKPLDTRDDEPRRMAIELADDDAAITETLESIAANPSGSATSTTKRKGTMSKRTKTIIGLVIGAIYIAAKTMFDIPMPEALSDVLILGIGLFAPSPAKSEETQ
jgi:hypothetical protein